MCHIAKKLKDIIRFDYFKPPVKIAGYDYVVSFDVEIFPSTNNYRTHKIINEMDLTLVNPNALVGPNPTAQGIVSNPFEANLPQSNNSVNTNSMQSNENSQNSKISDAEMFEVIGGKVGTLNNSTATKVKKALLKLLTMAQSLHRKNIGV